MLIYFFAIYATKITRPRRCPWLPWNDFATPVATPRGWKRRKPLNEEMERMEKMERAQ